MRTSDWSSDVCSSDLIPDAETALPKSVKAASGNPGEVERGRTKAADARNLGRNGVKDLFELPEIAMTQERNAGRKQRSEEHTSELQSLMRISYAVFCLKKKKQKKTQKHMKYEQAHKWNVIN